MGTNRNTGGFLLVQEVCLYCVDNRALAQIAQEGLLVFLLDDMQKLPRYGPGQPVPGQKFFTHRVVRYWNRLCREAVDALVPRDIQGQV